MATPAHSGSECIILRPWLASQNSQHCTVHTWGSQCWVLWELCCWVGEFSPQVSLAAPWAAGSQSAQYSESAIFWHAPLALQIQHTGMETHWKCVSFDEILPETRQMQSDILLAKQFLKASLPPPTAAHLAGWWGDGRQGMESAKPQAPASLAEGLPRASWLLDLLASLWALEVLWRQQPTLWSLREFLLQPYGRDTFLSLYVFLLFWNQIWLKLVSLAGFFYFLVPFIFEYRISQGTGRAVLVISSMSNFW